jgi:hypothetical protein
MTATFLCGNCEHEVVVQFLKPGETAKCKACGADNIVPASVGTTTDKLPQAQIVSPAGKLTSLPRVPVAPVTLVSPGISYFVTLLNWIDVVLCLVLVLLGFAALQSAESGSALTSLGTFINRHSSANWQALGAGSQTFLVIALIFAIFVEVVYLIWMYRVHKDLGGLYPGYKISPGKAVAQLIIPVYNIYGIWNVYTTLSNSLSLESGKMSEHGRFLRTCLILFYAGNILAFVFYIPGRTHPAWAVFHWVMLLLCGVFSLAMIITVRKAIALKGDAVNETFARP